MLEQKNSRKQGDVGLGAAIAYFTATGLTVCVPLTDNQDYDLVVEFLAEGLSRVSVKTSRREVAPGVYYVNLAVRSANTKRYTIKAFDPTSADYLFLLVANGDRYFIPTNKITSSSIQVGRKWLEYKLERWPSG